MTPERELRESRVAKLPTITLTDWQHFWSKVEKTPTCWLWPDNALLRGYGKFYFRRFICFLAHRFAYMATRGPIPSGMTIDHLCRVERCVNPAHLEVVTMRENTMRGTGPSAINARKTHCKNGHPLIGEVGWRQCYQCGRLRYDEKYRKRKRGLL